MLVFQFLRPKVAGKIRKSSEPLMFPSIRSYVATSLA